ncbi:MAG: SHOCT domain-containing protein [Thermovirgaceae bacterium]|nr:SHOCT domain-containing protein [Thermovirgaceae bacterium]
MKMLSSIAALFAAGGVAEAAEEGTRAWDCAWRWGSHMMYGFPGGMFMMMLLFLGVAVLFYFAFRKHSESRPAEFTRETPMEILKRRFAKGEISKEQFEEMKKDLS